MSKRNKNNKEEGVNEEIKIDEKENTPHTRLPCPLLKKKDEKEDQCRTIIFYLTCYEDH